MADSRIEIKVGSISFSGEGSGEWLAKQLDKVLFKIPELVAVAPDEGNTGLTVRGDKQQVHAPSHGTVSGTLAAHLKSTGSTSVQVRKFLATALWLHDTQKKDRLTTREVSAALNTNNQGKLKNASDALNQNVGKGFCEKDGKAFYVTPDGRASLSK
jgi:hypothetical protein